MTDKVEQARQRFEDALELAIAAQDDSLENPSERAQAQAKLIEASVLYRRAAYFRTLERQADGSRN